MFTQDEVKLHMIELAKVQAQCITDVHVERNTLMALLMYLHRMNNSLLTVTHLVQLWQQQFGDKS